jgi:hypothetical protein
MKAPALVALLALGGSLLVATTSAGKAQAQPKVCVFIWAQTQVSPTAIERQCAPGDTLYVQYVPDNSLVAAIYCDMSKQIVSIGPNLICVMRSPLGVTYVDGARR